MYSKEQELRSRVSDLIGSGLLGGRKRRTKRGGAIPGGNLMSLFNPLSMLGLGAGVVKGNRKYKGGGVVNSQANYEGGAMNPMSMAMSMFNPLAMLGSMGRGQMGGGVVNSQADYKGGGIGDSMGIPRWINWFGIGKKPRAKRGPSARGQKISNLMRTKGMTLGEASKYLKQHGE
jgi:hypothetical protein